MIFFSDYISFKWQYLNKKQFKEIVANCNCDWSWPCCNMITKTVFTQISDPYLWGCKVAIGVATVFSFSFLRKGIKSLAIQISRLYGSVRIIVTISLSSKERFQRGERAWELLQRETRRGQEEKKPMRIIKCCMINEHFLESFSVCLELTLQHLRVLQNENWFHCITTSLQTPANMAPPLIV